MAEESPAESYIDPKSGTEPFRLAVSTFDSGDYAAAFSLFQGIAEQGNAMAMLWVGFMLSDGKGVETDVQAALGWYTRAAALGDSEAMRRLGHAHHCGVTGQVDYERALDWYKQGAEAGDSDAMIDLGCMYSFGEGCAVDTTGAQYWFQKAARSGNRHGQYNLGALLVHVDKDSEAEPWFQAAADQGHPGAKAWLLDQAASRLIKRKRYVEALPDLTRLASDGSAHAHELLGWLYTNGKAVRKDIIKATRHYEAAYAGGIKRASLNIGQAHFLQSQPEPALEWLRRDPVMPVSSLYWQYRVLRKFPHLQIHPNEWDETLMKAADAGHLFAQRDLSILMMKGERRFGSRLSGLSMWLALAPKVVKLLSKNKHDERLS